MRVKEEESSTKRPENRFLREIIKPLGLVKKVVENTR